MKINVMYVLMNLRPIIHQETTESSHVLGANINSKLFRPKIHHETTESTESSHVLGAKINSKLLRPKIHHETTESIMSPSETNRSRLIMRRV